MTSLPESYAHRISHSLPHVSEISTFPTQCANKVILQPLVGERPVRGGAVVHGSDGGGDVYLEWSQLHVVITPMFLQTPRMISI